MNPNTFEEGYRSHKPRKVVPVTFIPIVEEVIVQEFPVLTASKLIVQNLTPNVTASDGDLLSNSSFTMAPMASSYIYITVNGVAVYAANGASEQAIKSFYVTDSTDTIVRPQGSFIIGDIFHWNGSVAGYEIDTTDRIKLIYHA